LLLLGLVSWLAKQLEILSMVATPSKTVWNILLLILSQHLLLLHLTWHG
jgi:hypothetical protein